MSPPLTITGHSTALFSTWYFVKEYGVLFDCGDGVCASLLQKSRRVKHVFISHADRDHLTGLLQFLQLNGRPELHIYYPKDCGSFPALANFCSQFDPHAGGANWVPIEPSVEVAIRDDLVVRPIENGHVPTDGTKIKSLSYAVDLISRKLKPEFVGQSGAEIGKLRKQHGRDAITIVQRRTQLIYSGDTPVEAPNRYQDADVLIHEATFLMSAEIDPNDPKRNKHSSLDEVMDMVKQTNVKMLVLGHFSSRYNNDEIDQAVDREAKRCEVNIPIKCVYPGETSANILLP